MKKHDDDNPMQHPEEQPTGSEDDSPKFGRLLLVLLAAVCLIAVISLVSEALYT